ncbi:MAG: hypothetical protein IJK93_08055 [Muribaculaceae bacterium]|nr:hypothetical protein [Muribaculaceae bacterium]
MDKQSLEQTKKACARGQKRGLHFIMASVIIWALVAIVNFTKLPIETKNLLTFCCTCPLMPLAWMLSKPLGITFSDKENPLSSLGIIMSMAQIPYLLIVMWVYAAVPEKMVMTLAMVFGAHLLPFGWLYDSKVYYIMSAVVTIGALVLGLMFPPQILALCMVAVEIIFCLLLVAENKNLK